MEDTLSLTLRLFELNETYHDKKERMIWLATTIYLGFVATSIDRIYSIRHSILSGVAPLMILFIIAFVIAFIFIFIQNKLKAQSVDINKRLRTILRSLDSGKRTIFSEVNAASQPPVKRCARQWIAIIWSYGKGGILCLIATAGFLAAQLMSLKAVIA
jgi:Zn-dependent protease with chaperone function